MTAIVWPVRRIGLAMEQNEPPVVVQADAIGFSARIVIDPVE